MSSGIISEPYYGFNDVNYEWVALEDWTFYRSFIAPKDLLGQREIILVAHGIDTACEIVVNGIHLLSASNMFVRYEIDVKSLLKRSRFPLGSEDLRQSMPTRHAKPRGEAERGVLAASSRPTRCAASARTPTDNDPELAQALMDMDDQDTETQVSSAVDANEDFLSPDEVLQGESTSDAENKEKDSAEERDDEAKNGQWQRKNTISVRCESPVKYAKRMHDSRRDAHPVYPLCPPAVQKGHCHVNWIRKMPCSFSWDWAPSFPSTGIWKPIRLEGSNGIIIRDVLVATIPQKDFDDGTAFYFVVNDIPVYAKGSNWVPPDIFPERIANDYVKELLLSVKEANMNMLRVWAGGVYETDYFYSLADELGILIWQDFMFSASLYPADQPFLQSVATEVQQQVRRLQYHPSLVVWAGNNENEDALASGWW
ncbi:beta-mannosidase [Rhipicephalus microplus]|uniref:beta-mannosidase n=1 Tax=Rhipicephalus microplus TaxID=6941 RepID=UPI003F6AE076